jgi:hypothetical protein
MDTIEFLRECAATPDHLPALLSRFLVRLMRLRMPDESLYRPPAPDGLTMGEKHQEDDFGSTIRGSGSSPMPTLAVLLDGQNHLVSGLGLDVWLDNQFPLHEI